MEEGKTKKMKEGGKKEKGDKYGIISYLGGFSCEKRRKGERAKEGKRQYMGYN